jgi:hypothetical protein
VRVAVDQAGEQRLAAPAVDLGAGIRLEELIGGSNRRDPVAIHRKRDLVAHGIRRDDRGVGKDDGSPRRRLRVDVAGLEQQRGRAGAGSRDQLAPCEIA